MKLVVSYPDGREIRFERQPMDKERFSLTVGIIYALIGAHVVIRFIELMVSR